MIKGVDLSALSQIEHHGGRYFLHGEEKDCIRIMKECGVDLIRLRLFNDPFDEEGNSYGAGECDLNSVIRTAGRVEEAGMEWLLDFHYSDCWADPGKQTMPKAWRGLNADELERELYLFTKESLERIKNKGLSPSIIAIGNEITNGICWPIGHKNHFEDLVRLINAGIRAAREVFPESKIMLHLDNGGRNDIYVDFFDRYFALDGEDFDFIGLSYYFFWHGTMGSLKENMDDLALRYGKDLIVAETSYVFTDEDYQEYEKLASDMRKGMATKPELLKDLPFPISEEGQSEYMRSLMDLISSVKDNRGKGFIYWGGEYIPVPGVNWADPSGIAYMHEKGPGGNEWANQALFDYDGNALKILDTIKETFK